MAMGFTSLVSSRLQYDVTRSASDFAGIGGDGGLHPLLPITSGKEMHSPNERIESLGEAFAGVPNDLGFPSAVGFRVVVHGRERELRAGLRDEVYRIGREAIVNACRHSQATAIEMEIEYRPNELRITVRDNGCGIDPQELQWGRNGHGGLQGMREQAERIGARLRLWSRVALGTEIELRVPCRVAH
jgi:signal transduction histidine kinase